MLVRTPFRSNSGGALVFALLAVLLVGSLAASFLEFSAAITRRQSRSIDTKEALYLAEAGLSEAFTGITIGRTGNVGSRDEPAIFGNGLFWVEATDIPPDLIQLDATGMAGTARAELSTTVQKGLVSIASLGIFGNGTIIVQPGTTIDGYNSEEADYDPSATSLLDTFSGGRLGSNGPVFLFGTTSQPTRIAGDVSAGPNDVVTTDSNVTVTGSLTSAYEPVTLPAVVTPGLAPATGITHSGATPYLIQPGLTALESLVVEPGAEVRMIGPATIQLGTFHLEPQANLLLDAANGPIDLYVSEELKLELGSTLSSISTDTTQVSLQVSIESDDAVRLEAAGGFYGVVYAPLVPVQVGSQFELFGSIVARDLLFQGSVNFHFDEKLLTNANRSALPKLVSWRIQELAAEPGAETGASPFGVLGVDPALLPSPYEAHEDVFLEIGYVNGAGNYTTWQGMESSFDWNSVEEPISVQRAGEPVPLFEEARSPNQVAANSAEQALLDSIAAAATSSEVKQILIDSAPVSDAVILAAIVWPGISSADLKAGLEANVPLSDLSVFSMLNDAPMSVDDLRSVLETSSPLSETSLLESIAAVTLDSSNLASVLITNSPLSATVLSVMSARIPPLDPADLTAILAAQ